MILMKYWKIKKRISEPTKNKRPRINMSIVLHCFISLQLLAILLLILGTVEVGATYCIGGSCDTCNCNYKFRGVLTWCDSSTSVTGCCGADATPNCQTYCCSSTKCQQALESQYLPLNTPIVGSCTGETCGDGTAKACWSAISGQSNEQMQSKKGVSKKSK